MKDDCVRKHIEFIDNLCTDLGVEVQKDDVKNLKRIGKKGQKKTINNTETVIPRILIATLTEEAKAKIMRNAYKLSSSERYKKIGIKHDMSKEESLRKAKLKKEAKEKQRNEASGNFIFLVRGLPWERKIVKIGKMQGGRNTEAVDTVKEGEVEMG